jgi:predicted RNase H-like HicB family nuclease
VTTPNCRIALRSEPEEGYAAIVPELFAGVTYARTIQEARRMVKDATAGSIRSFGQGGEEALWR